MKFILIAVVLHTSWGTHRNWVPVQLGTFETLKECQAAKEYVSRHSSENVANCFPTGAK